MDGEQPGIPVGGEKTGSSKETGSETPATTPEEQKESAKTTTKEQSQKQRDKLRQSQNLDKVRKLENEIKTLDEKKNAQKEKARKTINDPASLAGWRKKPGFKEYSPATVKEESSTLYLVNQGLEGNFTPEKVKEGMAKSNIQADGKTMEALTNPLNLGVIEQVAKEIGFEYLINSDAGFLGKLDSAKEYFTKLAEDLQSKLLGKVLSLYESNKDRFDSQISMVEKFSKFSGLDFIKHGILQKNGIKKLMILEPSAYESIFNDFSTYLESEKEMESKQSELGKLKGAPSGAETPAGIGTENQDTAKNRAEEENQRKKAEQETEQAMVTAIEQAEATKEAENPGDGATFDVSKFKTGIPFIDKLLANPFIAKIAGPLISLFMSKKAGEKARFETLGADEKLQAEAFEKALEKAGAKKETIAPLFKNDAAIKLILNSRKKANLSWKEFIDQRIEAEELSKLKAPATLKASAILKLFL